MVITAVSDDDNRKNLCEAIAQDFYKGVLPYRGYRLIDLCLQKYHYTPEDTYDLFVVAQEKGLLYKFAFLEGVAEYRYQHSVSLLLIIFPSDV